MSIGGDCPVDLVVLDQGIDTSTAELTVAQIAAEFGVTRPTICRHLDRLDQLDQSAATTEEAST